MRVSLPSAAFIALGLSARSASATYKDHAYNAAYVCEPNVEFDLYIGMHLDAPDGGTTRVTITANETIPGPEIRVMLGDCVKVNIHNELPGEGVTIHYHGISMKGSPWEDGTSFMSECPIQPGTSKSHVFKPESPGTYWYHSHIAEQMTDGVYGAFIVEDPDNDYMTMDHVCFPPGSDYCIETAMYTEGTLLISDWWTVDSRTQSAGIESQTFVWIGDPQAVLINGASAVDDEDTPMFSVLADFTYRVRLICASSLSFIRFGLESHSMVIVAADGLYVEPVEVDYVDCSNGQRYDVLIAANQKPGAYWLYAHSRYRTVVVSGRARVVYEGAETMIPATNVTALIDAAPLSSGVDAIIAAAESIEYDKQLRGTIALPEGNPDVYSTYVLSQQRMSKDGSVSYTPYDAETQTFDLQEDYESGYLRWALNDMSYSMVDTPILLASYTGLYEEDGIPSPLIIELEKDAYVQVVLQNGLTQSLASDQHPFHLHGHSFWVLGKGTGTYDPEESSKSFNYDYPVYRDTVTVYPYSWTVIRFKADNPGAWPLHCHIGAHNIMGMALVYLVGASDIPGPPPGTAVCGRVSPRLMEHQITFNSGFYEDDNE